MSKIINRGDLLSWLKQLAEKRTVIAPVTSDEVTLYQEVKGSEVDRINLNFSNTDLSPKSWFFPPSETLFTIFKDENSEITPAEIKREAVIFGIRPCYA